MSNPIEDAITDALVCLFMAAAAFGAGYMTRALGDHNAQIAKTATHEAQAVKAGAQHAQAAETQIVYIHDKVAAATAKAHHDIDTAPSVFTIRQPSADDLAPLTCARVDPDLVWRDFAERYNRVLDAGEASGPSLRLDAVLPATPRSE